MHAGIPPITTDKFSRLIFFDLAPEIERLRQEGTAFIPHSVRIEPSAIGFNDAPYIESVRLCPPPCRIRGHFCEPPPTSQPHHLTGARAWSQMFFANRSCPISYDQFRDSFSFGLNTSRSSVSFFVRATPLVATRLRSDRSANARRDR
jgi:hypothetical protein